MLPAPRQLMRRFENEPLGLSVKPPPGAPKPATPAVAAVTVAVEPDEGALERAEGAITVTDRGARLAIVDEVVMMGGSESTDDELESDELDEDEPRRDIGGGARERWE